MLSSPKWPHHKLGNTWICQRWLNIPSIKELDLCSTYDCKTNRAPWSSTSRSCWCNSCWHVLGEAVASAPPLSDVRGCLWSEERLWLTAEWPRSDGHGVPSGEVAVPCDAVPTGEMAGGQEDPGEPVTEEQEKENAWILSGNNNVGTLESHEQWYVLFLLYLPESI